MCCRILLPLLAVFFLTLLPVVQSLQDLQSLDQSIELSETKLQTLVQSFDFSSSTSIPSELKLEELRQDGLDSEGMSKAQFIARQLLSSEVQFCEPVITENKLFNAPVAPSWMSALDDSMTLTDITLPGSHDSGAFALTTDFNPADPTFPAVEPFLSFPGFADSVCKFAVTQTLSVLEQLNSGIRYLDLRVEWDAAKSEFRIQHLLFGLEVQEIFTEIATFLEANEDEIVLVEMTQLRSKDVTIANKKQLQNLIVELLGDYLVPRSSSEDLAGRSLADLRTANERLIVAVEDEELADHPSFFGNSLIKNTFAGTTDVDTMVKYNQGHLASFEKGEGFEGDQVFYKLSWALTPKEDYLKANFFGGDKSLYTLALGANVEATPFAASASSKQLGHIIMFDFIETSDVIRSFGCRFATCPDENADGSSEGTPTSSEDSSDATSPKRFAIASDFQLSMVLATIAVMSCLFNLL